MDARSGEPVRSARRDVEEQPGVSPRPRPVNAMSIDVEDFFQVSAFEGVISRASWDTFAPRVERNEYRMRRPSIGTWTENAPRVERRMRIGNDREIVDFAVPHGARRGRVVEFSEPKVRQEVFDLALPADAPKGGAGIWVFSL